MPPRPRAASAPPAERTIQPAVTKEEYDAPMGDAESESGEDNAEDESGEESGEDGVSE